MTVILLCWPIINNFDVKKSLIPPYHVPWEVSHPVRSGVDSADKLQMFGLGDTLLHQEQDEAGWDERQREDHWDGDQHITHTLGSETRRNKN